MFSYLTVISEGGLKRHLCCQQPHRSPRSAWPTKQLLAGGGSPDLHHKANTRHACKPGCKGRKASKVYVVLGAVVHDELNTCKRRTSVVADTAAAKAKGRLRLRSPAALSIIDVVLRSKDNWHHKGPCSIAARFKVNVPRLRRASLLLYHQVYSQLSSTRTSFHHGCRQLHIQIARSLEGRGEPTVRHAWKHSNSPKACKIGAACSCRAPAVFTPQPASMHEQNTQKINRNIHNIHRKWTPTSPTLLPRLVTVRSSRSRGVFPWEGSPALAAVPRLGPRLSDVFHAYWHTGCRQPGGA